MTESTVRKLGRLRFNLFHRANRAQADADMARIQHRKVRGLQAKADAVLQQEANVVNRLRRLSPKGKKLGPYHPRQIRLPVPRT